MEAHLPIKASEKENDEILAVIEKIKCLCDKKSQFLDLRENPSD